MHSDFIFNYIYASHFKIHFVKSSEICLLLNNNKQSIYLK